MYPELKINRWTLVRQVDSEHWLCRCECGTEKPVESWTLAYGTSKSCGCLHRELVAKRFTKHGMCHTRTYNCYWNMIRRCEALTGVNYKYYGGRGIEVCTKWRESFDAFMADMGPCPSSKHSLDRYPNQDGNYEPGNVRWATAKQQGNNNRRNHMLTFRGRTQNITQWAEELGWTNHCLSYRVSQGWTVEDTLTIPPSQSGWTAKRMRG
jgi:hypothetical protein